MTTAHLWLIVDDDVVFADTLARRLQRRGDRVLLAHDAGAALEHALAKPDRVILDLRLGKESGLQLLPRLRERLPNGYIVVLTGYASIATAIHAMKQGADYYLPKPVLFEDLISAFDAPTIDPDASAQPTMSPRRLEWEHLQRVLDEENGNISNAARRLGMHRRTLQRKLLKRPVPQ
jgi:two-component system, response regulator RegA